MRLVTNSNKPNDRMSFLLSEKGKNKTVYIASAFFSDYELLLKMVENGCSIHMVIRLDVGTSAEALLKVIDNPNIYIRYFTGKKFHPKFYIFGSEIAYLGSANCTHQGLMHNAEANVELTSEESAFADLCETFQSYWNEASVLSKETIETFKKVTKGLFIPDSEFILKEAGIGNTHYNNNGMEGDSRSKEELFISDFKKSYQLYIGKFNLLKEMYENTGIRRYPELPLRIEVDRFLWWLGEDFAKGDSYKNIDEQPFETIQSKVKGLVSEFEVSKNEYLDHTADADYYSLVRGFSSAKQISNYDYDELFDVLCNVYAFAERLRYFPGGLKTMKQRFLELNSLDKIKKSIIYLIYGTEEYELRVYRCSRDKEYKLAEFGDSCIKELLGRVNQEEIPICNGRSLKSMQWLGFGKLD